MGPPDAMIQLGSHILSCLLVVSTCMHLSLNFKLNRLNTCNRIGPIVDAEARGRPPSPSCFLQPVASNLRSSRLPTVSPSWLSECFVPERFEKRVVFIPAHVSTFGKTHWTSEIQQALLTMLPRFTTPRCQEVLSYAYFPLLPGSFDLRNGVLMCPPNLSARPS